MQFKDITTLKIGGPIKEFTRVGTEDELIRALRHTAPYLVIGGGSNLLVSDSGFDGLVIKNEISGIEKKSGILRVKSGTDLQELVNFSIENSFSGMHKLTGIPGTVGGALFGNAGAFGQTISDYLEKVIVSDGKKKLELTKAECEFEYRDSAFKRTKYTILEAIFKLPSLDKETIQKESAEVLERRLKKYPPGVLCPGSFFKNLFIKDLPEDVQKQIPENRDYFGKVPAWFFLDEVGAKGDKLCNIKIADFHGNLFINTGGGTAEDFYNLAKKYFLKVKGKFGIELDPEVQLINLPPFNTQ